MKDKLHPIEEYDLDTNIRWLSRAVKIKVGEKQLSYQSASEYHGDKFTFKKQCRNDGDFIVIEAQKAKKERQEEKCDLGHVHVTEKPVWEPHSDICLNWDEFEALIVWFQNGKYHDPRTREGKRRKELGLPLTGELDD